jgi:ASC-1-like (ASCH) protein
LGERVIVLDEKMFKRLLLAGEGDDNIDELIKLGYFKRIEGRMCRSNKYLEETGSFIESKKETLYEAVKQLGSAEDLEKTMELAGIRDFITFVFIAEELVRMGNSSRIRLKIVLSNNCLYDGMLPECILLLIWWKYRR